MIKNKLVLQCRKNLAVNDDNTCMHIWKSIVLPVIEYKYGKQFAQGLNFSSKMENEFDSIDILDIMTYIEETLFINPTSISVDVFSTNILFNGRLADLCNHICSIRRNPTYYGLKKSDFVNPYADAMYKDSAQSLSVTKAVATMQQMQKIRGNAAQNKKQH